MSRLIRSSVLTALLSLGIPMHAQSATPVKAKNPPAETSRIYNQAYAEMQKKAYGTALPLYEKALALAPVRAEIWNEYGICLRNLRRFPAAVRAGWRAIQLDGGRSVQPWNAQASALMETREWRAAQTCLERVETLHKDRPFVAKSWLNLAFRMMAAGSSEGIVDICLRAARVDPGNSLAWIDLGQAQACAGGDPKEVNASLEKGLAMAEQQKDAQRAEYAKLLMKKVKAGESVWPPALAERFWQTLPINLLRLPEGDASQVALPPVVEHHYMLSDGGTLSLSLPEAWAEAPGIDRPENLFTVQFTIPGSEGFKVFFSPLLGVGNPLGVKATADEVAKRLLSGSAEKELTPHELASTTMKGYWILSTDKKTVDKEPVKGEYRHLISILMDVSGLQCVGTVLTNSEAPEVIDPCLAAFSTARRVNVAVKR